MTLAEKINAALDDKKTITVATYMRIVRVKPKHRDAWMAAGFPFFKTDKANATLMIDGQSNGKPRYVCIDFAKVSAS